MKGRAALVRALSYSRWLAVLLPVVSGACAAGRFGVRGDARKPLPSDAFAVGLPRATEGAVPGRTLALRPPLEGRVPIPGGTFLMGARESDLRAVIPLCDHEPLGSLCGDKGYGRRFQWEAPVHPVTLSSFELDRTEVTVAAYERCVASDACPAPRWKPHDPRYDRPDFPVTFVDWDAAGAYCAWAGGRLPTEAEWEYAARGPEERRFPWGDVYNPYLSNHGSLSTDALDATDGFLGLAPVGSFPDGRTPTGLYDMAGNVAEWVADRFEDMPRGYGYEAGAQVNPTGPTTGATHVIRGGDYTEGAPGLRTTARARFSGVSPSIGFRCAATLR